MATAKLTPQELLNIRQLATQWGKIIARRAFGDAGPGLTEGTLAALVEQQLQSLSAEQACPDCGQPCPVGHEPRALTGRGGTLTYREPVCHCPACRRDFFPAAARVASGRP